MWEGLGYYNLAKNLHKTATLIDELINLPGIGKNTAHAVAIFAFNQPVPIMEANVKRILCRLNKLKTPNDKELWNIAYELVDKVNPFDYSQAMMDIGATICLSKNPKIEPYICKGEVTHAYTHFKLICKVCIYYKNSPDQMDYFSEEEIQKLAISKVDEKIVKLFLKYD